MFYKDFSIYTQIKYKYLCKGDANMLYVKTNKGLIPIEDYLNIQAIQNGFSDYEDLRHNKISVDISPKDIVDVTYGEKSQIQSNYTAGQTLYINPDIDMRSIKDSMQLDSGQTIASLKSENSYVSIEVRGEVKVWYNDKGDPGDGEYYTSPSQFPKELKELIENNPDWYTSPHVYISENNWFEIFAGEDENDPIPTSDVIDIEGSTMQQLFEALDEFAKEYEIEQNNDLEQEI